MFNNGEGGPQDKVRARELYELGCRGGIARGCRSLGILFSVGKGGPQDKARARDLYEQACTGGDARGCFFLGLMFGKGEGGAQDRARARDLFEQACKGGDVEGCNVVKALGAKAPEENKDQNLASRESSRDRTGEEPVKSVALAGQYDVNGRDPQGKRYRGTAEITEMGEDRYRFRWRVGNSSYTGSGRFEGGKITVDWGDKYPVIYEPKAEGVLVGTWANGRATETLRPRN
jgi:hypothetical protein